MQEVKIPSSRGKHCYRSFFSKLHRASELTGKPSKGRMRPGELTLVWVLLCAGIVWGEYGSLYVNGDVDEANIFLDQKEEQVVRIASMAVANEEKTCDLVANCSSECSRRECFPLKSDNLTCTAASVNTFCTDSAGGYCTDTRVNFMRSYVTAPGLFYSAPDQIPFEVQNAVCSQRTLDPLFKELQKLQNKSAYYFSFYFGSVDGSFREFPGMEDIVDNCKLYDARKRPWYLGAISVLKDVVLLLDSGFTMGNNLGSALYQTTKLAAAQSVTQMLLETMTPNDRVTVATFNASDVASTVGSYVVPDAGLNFTDANFRNLLMAVNNTPPSSILTQEGSNFTAGLTQAAATFNESSPLGALKIVILFTDGSSSPSTAGLDPILKQFLQEPVKLIIYQIGDASSLSLGQTACSANGLFERLNALNVLQNPLFAVNSYFSFMARSQEQSSEGKRPFWQPIYKDASSLGSVITVAHPAMTSDGSRLIGVAGIDVQIDGLGLNFKNLLDNDLVNSRRIQISVNTNGSSFENCKPAYNDSLGQCSSSDVAFSPFCEQDDFTSAFSDLVCCADCGRNNVHKSRARRSDSSGTLILATVIPAVALLAAFGVSMFLWIRFCRHKPKTESPRDYVEIVKVPKFSYEALSMATNNFADKNKLGFGTFGTVYMGILDDGTKVAVKRLFHMPSNGTKDFEAEIKVLATANHTNLVALKGFCMDRHNILVYEFVDNFDLDNWLFVKPDKEGKILLWKDRVNIAKGMARGLSYLHEELQNSQKVCHSDIKPANILLDADFNPKVADFGMAKLYEGDSDLDTTGGTFGYIAPEILDGAPSTTKTDVYAYGMVLLEMVTGRRFTDHTIGSLPIWAARNVAEQKDVEIFDPSLGELEEGDEFMAKKLVRIALQCTSVNPDLRPCMSDVVKMIEGIIQVRSLPLSTGSGGMKALSMDTTSVDFKSTRSQSRSQSEGGSGSGASLTWDKSWTFSDAINKLRLRRP